MDERDEGAMDGTTTGTGDRVRQARTLRNWSQEALAAAAGISEKTIRRLEAGEPVSGETLLSVAAALDVDAATLGPRPSPMRWSIPTEGEATDGIRRMLADEASRDATVMAVDTDAYLRANLGMDREAAMLAMATTPSTEARATTWSAAFVVSLLVLVIGVCLAATKLQGTASSAVAGVVAGVPFVLVMLALHRDGKAIRRRTETECLLRYADAMRRSVIAVDRGKLVVHSLDAEGRLKVAAFPLQATGHSSRDLDGHHLAFTFAHVDGTVEVPFVPLDEVTLALARRLGAAIPHAMAVPAGLAPQGA